MKTFRIFSSSLIGLLIIVSLSTAAFAAGPTTTTVQATVKPLKIAVDLLIQYIEYFNCPCTLNQALNTEYVTDRISVKVGNPSTVNSVGARITVLYYDVSLKSNVTVTKTITLNANQWTKVLMVEKPLLIRKSTGVTAVIEHTSTSFTDPNPANNRLVQKTCGQVPE